MSIEYLQPVSSFQEAIQSIERLKDSTVTLGVEIKHLNLIPKEELPYPYFYWKSRSSKTIYQAWGIAETFKNLDSCPQTKVPRFASFRFSDSTQGSTWANFPMQLIWTPRWCLEQGEKDILYFSPCSISERATAEYLPSELNDAPTQDQWIQNIIEAQSCFASTNLQKIVLARQSKRHSLDAESLFSELRVLQKNCYHFLLSPNQNESFFGVSPERLLKIEGTKLQTEAVAGTRATSVDNIENAHLSDALFHSKKDQNEHGIVIQYITERLVPFCTEINIKPMQLLSLHHVQHLQTPILADLKEDVSLTELLAELHPTPAVCGLPKDKAMEKISHLEDFDRGFYAGTIGIITDQTIDFTVSIRSALWKNGELLVWAGAGIVPQSDPIQEWVELNNKSKQFFERSEP